MKNIIITGSSGLVATELTLYLLDKNEYNLFLLSTSPSKLIERYKGIECIKCFTLDEFKIYNQDKNINYHCLINAGFARSSEGDKLAVALQYTRILMEYATTISLKGFVNISSQSVYGHLTEPLWTEVTSPAPDYMYALGKYSTELLSHSIFGASNVNYTNIRLSSVCENARFMNIFCKNAINGIPITLTAPDQVTSFIDVRDVARALYRVIESVGSINFHSVYNLGTNECYTIREIAQIIKTVGKTNYGYDVDVVEKGADNTSKIGMDSRLFREIFSWEPTINMVDMVESLYEYNLHTPPKKNTHHSSTRKDVLNMCDIKEYPRAFDIVYR